MNAPHGTPRQKVARIILYSLGLGCDVEMRKRSRADLTPMHATMVNLLKSVSRESAAKYVRILSAPNLLGIECGKKGSLPAQILEYKRIHPEKIILVRVGEMYEAVGVDAVLVVDSYIGCDMKNGEPRVAFHASKVQHVLDSLIGRGITSAIFEESDVLCTPRHRYMAQIVSPATPLYGVDTGNTPLPLRIAGVMAHSDRTATVCLVDVQAGLCQRADQISAERAAALVLGNRVGRPVYVLRDIPAWLKHEEVIILGASPLVDIVDRVLEQVRLCLHVENVRVVPMMHARCAPLPSFTLQQLGLKNDIGVPNLVDYCLPRHAPSVMRRCMLEWLSAPPSEEVSACNRTIVGRIRGESVTIGMRVGGRAVKCVEATIPDADALRALRHNAHSLLESPIDVSGLIGHVSSQLGVSTPVECQAIVDIIETNISDEVMCCTDARGACFTMKLNSKTSLIAEWIEAWKAANEAVNAVTEGLHEGQLVRDSRGVAFRGRPDNATKLPVFDRNSRIVQNAFTTDALRRAEHDLAVRARELVDADSRCVADCIRLLQGYMPSIRTIEAVALHVATLVEHARASVCKSWCLSTVGEDLTLGGMQPYWMESAVVNQVSMRNGDVVILTAPNGGGKTTLLRAAASCMLLHQCGLAVPCKDAVIPNVDGIFLRCGSLDATLERRSSFASEMVDLRTILSTPGVVFAFVDEPCRGTSSTDGVALLRAVLEHLPSSLTTIVSTHYHELVVDSDRVRPWQLDAEVVDDDCRPRFKLTEGACKNSFALHVALAVGISTDIVRRARQAEDIDTLLLTNLYANEVQFERVGPRQTIGALRTALYVIDTVDGVYVGESDRIVQRIQAHERSKPTIKSFFVARCDNKSQARQLEACLINDLKFHNVVLLSIADGHHGI